MSNIKEKIGEYFEISKDGVRIKMDKEVEAINCSKFLNKIAFSVMGTIVSSNTNPAQICPQLKIYETEDFLSGMNPYNDKEYNETKEGYYSFRVPTRPNMREDSFTYQVDYADMNTILSDIITNGENTIYGKKYYRIFNGDTLDFVDIILSGEEEKYKTITNPLALLATSIFMSSYKQANSNNIYFEGITFGSISTSKDIIDALTKFKDAQRAINAIAFIFAKSLLHENLVLPFDIVRTKEKYEQVYTSVVLNKLVIDWVLEKKPPDLSSMLALFNTARAMQYKARKNYESDRKLYSAYFFEHIDRILNIAFGNSSVWYSLISSNVGIMGQLSKSRANNVIDIKGQIEDIVLEKTESPGHSLESQNESSPETKKNPEKVSPSPSLEIQTTKSVEWTA